MCMQLHHNLNYSSDQLLSEKNHFFLIVVLNLPLNNLNSCPLYWIQPDCVASVAVGCVPIDFN